MEPYQSVWLGLRTDSAGENQLHAAPTLKEDEVRLTFLAAGFLALVAVDEATFLAAGFLAAVCASEIEGEVIKRSAMGPNHQITSTEVAIDKDDDVEEDKGRSNYASGRAQSRSEIERGAARAGTRRAKFKNRFSVGPHIHPLNPPLIR